MTKRPRWRTAVSGAAVCRYVARLASQEAASPRITHRHSNILSTVGIVTALNPVLGYEKATELANEAYKSGKGILEIIREKKILSEAQIKELLDPVKLSGLDKSKYPRK